jgi:hypothetical protein
VGKGGEGEEAWRTDGEKLFVSVMHAGKDCIATYGLNRRSPWRKSVVSDFSLPPSYPRPAGRETSRGRWQFYRVLPENGIKGREHSRLREMFIPSFFRSVLWNETISGIGYWYCPNESKLEDTYYISSSQYYRCFTAPAPLSLSPSLRERGIARHPDIQSRTWLVGLVSQQTWQIETNGESN